MRVMQTQGSGSIVNISSTMGERGSANCPSRGASMRWKASQGPQALEAAAFGVRVNAVAPGPTDHRSARPLSGSPDQKAAFFASVPLKRGATPPGEKAGMSGHSNLQHP